MPEQLYIRFQTSTSDQAGVLEWLILDEQNSGVRTKAEGLTKGLAEELASYIEQTGFSGEIRLIAPGESFLLSSVKVPSRKPKKIIQAVPFAVEEELACDPDDCHFAIGELLDEGKVHVAVVNRHELENWLNILAEQNIVVDSIKVDVLQLPVDSQPVMLVEKDRLLFRRSKQLGQAAEIGMLSLLAKISSEVKENGLQILTDSSDVDFASLADINIDSRPLGVSTLEFLARNYDANGIEILQGQYKPHKKKDLLVSSVWRNAAIVTACAFTLHLFIFLSQGIYINAQANEIADASKLLYKEIFPLDKNVRDIRRRWRSHLGGGGGGDEGSFMELFAIAGTKITESGLKLENINFNASRGNLTLRIQAPRSEDLVALSQKLGNEGIDSRIGSIRQEENFVLGTLKIQSKDSG